MICTMIDYVEQHVPQDKIFVFSFGEWFFEQHIVPQFCQVSAHILLDAIPVGTKEVPIVKVSGIKRFWYFDASQSAKPCIIHAHEMNDLIPDRTMRVIRISDELFMG